MAAQHVTSARCYLALPEGARCEDGSDAEETNENNGEGEEGEGVEKKEKENAVGPMVNGNGESKESSVADKVSKSVTFNA